ncbi:capsular polysaccharide export protein, LipB/KpsS family [Halorubrum sp. FL23]|uniref:capsular polysaccharide export protein, LipB/KpsS family n=1 Tax=Halorubrum sp. FL23 TaxID=3458704 RepID=UPI004033E56A
MNVKHNILNLACRAGIGEEALSSYRTFVDSGRQIDLEEKISEFELDEAEIKGHVLIPSVEGFRFAHFYRDLILAYAFHTRGYKPVVPLCDRDMGICHRMESMPDDLATCAQCNYRGRRMVSEFGFDSVHLSEYKPNSTTHITYSKNSTYKDVDVSKYAKSSTRKFLKKYTLDFDDNHVEEVYTKFLKTAIKLVDATERLIDEYNPAAVLSYHPAYVYGGIFLAVAENHDIPAVGHTHGYRKESIVLGYHGEGILPQFTSKRFVEAELKKGLDGDEQDSITEILRGRQDGTDVRRHYSQGAKTSINGSNEQTSIGLFTNLIWDGSLVTGSGIFNGPLSWVKETISYAKNNTDINLIIKTHPAEDWLGTNEPVEQWIRENCSPLPQNIQILSPDTDVSPYRLMKDITVGVVYNSTIGLEMACDGLPVVTAGETHYKGYGFTYDPEDKHQYFNYLDSVSDLQSDPEMVSDAKTYAHILFEKRHFDYPYEKTKKDGSGFIPISHKELAPGAEPYDTIVEKILDQKTIASK